MSKRFESGSVVLVGVRYDQSSSFLPGAAEAPASIRAALRSPSANMSSETGLDLDDDPRFVDAGDSPLIDRQGYLAIGELIEAVLAGGARPLALGGDHAITYPLVEAVARHYGALDILHFDAHPDLYDELDGDRFSHACPFARIMEAGLAKRLVQVGIRTINRHQREQAERFGVEVKAMKDFDPDSFRVELDGPIYLSLDLDVLDPAFAPGVSHHEPGGLSVRELLHLIHRIRGPIVAADVVELNPRRDLNGMTAMVAAKLVKEIGAMMLGGGETGS